MPPASLSPSIFLVSRCLVAAFTAFAIACTRPEPSTPGTGTEDTEGMATFPARDAQGATCLGQGEGWCTSAVCAGPDGRIEHLPCCEGLAPVEGFGGGYSEKHHKCLVSKGGRQNCVACGNGRCERGENVCNCPRDCGSP